MPQMQQTGSLVWDAVISAIDACAARQSLCDANAAIWDRDADNAAMPQTQQYPLQYAVNATRGFGETRYCFDVSSHAATSATSNWVGCFSFVSTSLV